MKPSKLYEALHALIGERVPLHILRRLRRWESLRIRQNGRHRSFSRQSARASCFHAGAPQPALSAAEWVSTFEMWVHSSEARTTLQHSKAPLILNGARRAQQPYCLASRKILSS